MPRTIPALAAAATSALAASMVGGFLIASWTIGGISPVIAAPPRLDRHPTRVVTPREDWREASYEQIGLWERDSDARR